MSDMTNTQHAPFERNPAAADLVWDAMEALSEGIAVYDADNCIVTCNQRYVDMFPLIGDLIDRGARWEDLLRAGAERGQYADAMQNPEDWLKSRLDEGVPFNKTLEVQLASGAIYQVQFSKTQQGGFVVANTDITERRQAEAAAREQESMLRTVLETSPIAVVMARHEDGKILYRSPEAIRFFGNTESALEHYVDPVDRETYVAALLDNGRVDDYRIVLKDAQGKFRASTSWGRTTQIDGNTCIVTAIMDMSVVEEREAMIRQVLEACPAPIQMTKAETGEVLFSSPETISLFGRSDSAKQFYADPNARERYLTQLRRDGSVIEFKAQYMNAKGQPFWGAVSARLIRYNGEDVIVSHTRDLTDQMRIEEELGQQRDQLYQNEKMSAMGELLAGVAHELNNPLSVVVGHSLMLREDSTDPDTLRQVEKISDAAERCARIVKTFLTMARQEPAKKQQVDINEIIQTAVDVARYGDSSTGVSMTCELEPDLPLVSTDPDQITQVFINLILNAEQAIRDSGVGQNIAVITRQLSGDKGIEILIKDDGPGVPEHLRGRVFEPFFTTKEIGEGTGIGLALSHRIIQAHNGTIKLKKPQGDGTTFSVVLPLVDARAGINEVTGGIVPTPEKTRILIVDDEPDVADLNAEVLTRAGYRVDVFNHANDALDCMQHTKFGLILSDLNMPETDGRGFFEAIKQDHPDMINKTGFVTGDTMGRSSQGFLQEANRPCIEKPVSPKELRTFVAQILNKAE